MGIWISVKDRMPDSDETVLVAFEQDQGGMDWESAYWNGHQWISFSSGGRFCYPVQFWKRPGMPGECRLQKFAESMLDPERNGFSVPADVRDQARVALGRQRVEVRLG